jgi:hypothetical protein
MNDMVDRVIDYAISFALLDELLSVIEEHNPRQYAEFRNQLYLDPGPQEGESVESLFAEAQGLLEKDSLDDSIRLLQKLRRIRPGDEVIQSLFLEAMYRQGVRYYVSDYHLPKAHQAFTDIVRIDPYYRDALNLKHEVRRRLMPSHLASPAARPAPCKRAAISGGARRWFLVGLGLAIILVAIGIAVLIWSL